MNIDYEAIATELAKTTGSIVCAQNIKAIIEAYEAQKQQPEWVPLDLEKVKQGWEIRYCTWSDDTESNEFVCVYRDGLVTAHKRTNLFMRETNGAGWLMRAPKPKTVRVRVFKQAGGGYWPQLVGGDERGMVFVGEGDIEVSE